MTASHTEVVTKIDKIAKGIHDVQEIVDRNEKRIDALDKDQIQKMSTDISGIMEQMQEVKQKQKAQEEYSKLIEKQVYRAQDSSTGLNVEDQRAKNEFLRYLRKGDALSQDVVESICKDLARKSFLGKTDEELNFHTKSLVEGVNPEGGYWIRPQLIATMVKRIFETSPIRLVATTVNTTSSGIEMIIDDNEAATGGWVGEIDSRPTTATANIGRLVITAHEQYASPPATQVMLDDAGFDVEAWLMDKITDKIIRTENTAFVSGDGNLKPRGFLSLPAWTTSSTFTSDGTYERGKIDTMHSGLAGDFSADSIKALQNNLIEDYQPDAVWLMHRKTFERVITLKDAIGHYLLTPESLRERDEMRLLGAPVIFAYDMPQIAVNALAVAYGNFRRGYTIVDRLGFRLIRDQYTQKPFIIFYTTKRVGGDVTNYQSIKLLYLNT